MCCQTEELESSYKFSKHIWGAVFVSWSFCAAGEVSPLIQRVGLVVFVMSRLEFVFPASLTQGGAVTETSVPALPRPIVTLTHPWNVQLLPWAPELTAGNMNISEFSHISYSPSREPHALLSPPPTPLALRWDAGPVHHTPLLGSLQILHFHMRLFLFSISENGSILV